MTIEEEGQRIAEQLGRGFNYEGPQYDNGKFAFHWIGDPVTGTSFAATSLEGAKRRLTEVRKSFSAEPWSPYKVDRRKTMVEKRGISPAVVIAGGLGLALAGALLLYAIARAAPGVPPEPPPGYANLYGIITDAQTGEPIAGVQGTVYQDHDTDTEEYNFTTNASGYYVIKNMLVEVDVTQMVAYAEGYKPHTDEDIPIAAGNNELSFSMEVA